MKGYLQCGVALVSLGPEQYISDRPTTRFYPNPTTVTAGGGGDEAVGIRI